MLLISSKPLGPPPSACFQAVLHTGGAPPQTHTKHTLTFVTTESRPASPGCLSVLPPMYASSPPPAAMTMTLSHFHARTHPSFHSCKCALIALGFFFFGKGNKNTLDYSRTMGSHHGNKQRGAGAGVVCMDWDGV